MGIQVSVEQTSAIGRQVTVQVPAEQFAAEWTRRLQAEQRKPKRNLPGFRAGKIPMHMIQHHFGPAIRQESIDFLIQDTLPKALEEQQLSPAGRPQLQAISGADAHASDLSYTLFFEIYPECTLPDFSQMQVEQLASEVTEADVDRMIEKGQSQWATWAPVARAAQVGDRVTIDYQSTFEGKSYEGSDQQEVFVELGTGLFIPGLEQGLEGACVGETRALDLRFPSEWRLAKLANQSVHFQIQVKEVEEKIPAPLDETFAKKIGAEGSDAVAIRQKVRANLEQQLQAAIDNKTRDHILDQLVMACDIPLPEALVQSEMQILHEDLHRQQGHKAKEHTCTHEGLLEEAKRRVQLSLIFREIVKLKNLVPDEEKVKEKVLRIAKAYGNAEFVESMYHESNELLQGIRNSVLVDQSVSFILDQAKLSTRMLPLEALLNG